MKSKDIGLIVVIAIFSAVLSFIASNFIIPSSDREQSVETVGPISSEFQRPPEEYFNTESINPTQEIEIGQDENNNPFGNQ